MILSKFLPNTYGGKEMLVEFWVTLYEFDLFPKGLWEMYARETLSAK
jgi:hypothetical protein